MHGNDSTCHNLTVTLGSDLEIKLDEEAEAAMEAMLEYLGFETIDEYVAEMKTQMEKMYNDAEEPVEPVPFEKTENGFIMDDMEFTLKK